MSEIPFDRHGILLRRCAVAIGLDDNWLYRMVRGGHIVRIRHGAYADAAVWRSLTPAGRHVLLSRAVMLQYDDRVALSHASAHLLRGGPDWGIDLTRVHITNLFGRGDRIQAGITHHRGTVRVTDVTRTNEHWITTPARTAVETAALLDLTPAICVLDWTLHNRLATRDELKRHAVEYMREWADTVELPIAVERADGRSESVGETRSRRLLADYGLDPEPQWHAYHPSGRLAARVDLLLRQQRLMVEFDGQVKYGRLLKPGQTLDDVIKAERAREVLLEELTGLRMLRLVWRDLDHPQRVMDRVWRAAAHRAAG